MFCRCLHLKIVNYFDVTFNLNNGKYCPYRKPNNQPPYINAKSNHPPNIIKQLPDSISRRISDNSCNEDEFNKAMTEYDTALKSSGHTKTLTHNKHRQTTRPRRTLQRNIIWYNPPFSNNVQTNIGKTFLRLVSKHFFDYLKTKMMTYSKQHSITDRPIHFHTIIFWAQHLLRHSR